MMKFQVKIVDMDSPEYKLSEPIYIFDSLCFVSLSFAERKLGIHSEGIELFSVYINDMSIGGRLQPFHSWAIWGLTLVGNEIVAKQVRVELYIPEKGILSWLKKKMKKKS